MSAKDKLAHALQKIFRNEVPQKISISKLVALSKINRVTFYRNFRNVEELIKWFILKDLTFKYQGSKKFNFEYAFTKVFNFIDENIDLFKHLFNSYYFHAISEFIVSEIYTYQMSKFSEIDKQGIVSLEERIAYAKFYSHGIYSVFLNYINHEANRKYKARYLTIALRIVKGYMERAIVLVTEKRFESWMKQFFLIVA